MAKRTTAARTRAAKKAWARKKAREAAEHKARSEASKRGWQKRRARHKARSEASKRGWQKRRARETMAPLLGEIKRLVTSKEGVTGRQRDRIDRRIAETYAEWSGARDSARAAFDDDDFRDVLEWVADDAGYDDAADFADQYVED